MLSLHNVEYSYGDKVLSYPDWQIQKADHGLILGHSGSGKTTLLHLMGGLMRISGGTLEVAGQELSKLSNTELDQFRGSQIGIIFQRPHLVKSLSVKENLLLAQSLAKQKAVPKETEALLAALDISSIQNRKVHQISEGQAQRVSIARAIVNSPSLLLADEPTASLDDENCHRVINLLKNLSEQRGTTLVVATHDHRVKDAFTNPLYL